MNLGEMITDCGYYLNDTGLIRYDSTIRTRFINIAYMEYYNELVRVGHKGLLTTDDLNIVADTETVALPNDFFMIYKLSKNLTNERIPLNYSSKMQEVTYTSGAATGDCYIPDYSIQGSNIVLDPVPSTSVTDGLHLEYFPVVTAMSTSTSTPASGFSSQFHPMIPIKACILIKGTKEDETIGNLMDILVTMERPFRSLIQSLTKQRKRVSRFFT